MRVVALLATISMGCGDSDSTSGDAASGDASMQQKRVFVTSTTYRADFATASGTPLDAQDAGIIGANKLCQTAATAGALGGTWKAILAHPNGGIDALADVGPWYRTDATLAFNNRAQLKTTPSVAINVDELKKSQSASSSSCVWTGLMPGGAPLPGCAATGNSIWTFGNSAQNGVVGDLNGSDSSWIYTGTKSCDGPCHLYCLEQ